MDATTFVYYLRNALKFNETGRLVAQTAKRIPDLSY